ncbi:MULTISPECIES: RecX family transcriptional regulator [Jeotgalicoccus]|uniref:RecX family transcriptional regulator n=1 Tax=Jeotgalicoccus TaxID=227979 RepID=UPI0004116F15|nr:MULTISPECIES: RecX family transcriptional regulator [Jeotgalicoccus]QQD85081.1 RecX family transcriptional regulator [Jeotgalicoccus sp. ATCC 8456]
MEIRRIVKQKKEMYQVYFDDGRTLKVHEESLVRYMLIPGKVIEEDEFEALTTSIQFDQAYTKGLKFISYKLRSIQEMYYYLIEDFDNDIVKETINRLTNEGYLNDDQYAVAFRNTLLNTTDKGPGHLVRELKKQGIEEDIIMREKAYFDDLIDAERMNKLKHKFLKSHRGSYMQFKQKLQEKLIQRGYQKHHMEMIIFDDDFDEEHYFEKDFEKYYNKYQRKESGYKLKQKMIAAMMSKGYPYDKISEKLGGIDDE